MDGNDAAFHFERRQCTCPRCSGRGADPNPYANALNQIELGVGMANDGCTILALSGTDSVGFRSWYRSQTVGIYS
jgi:hypothetical protein